MPKIILKDGSEFIVNQAILEESILPAQPDEMIQLGKTYFKKSSIEIIHDYEKEKVSPENKTTSHKDDSETTKIRKNIIKIGDKIVNFGTIGTFLFTPCYVWVSLSLLEDSFTEIFIITIVGLVSFSLLKKQGNLIRTLSAKNISLSLWNSLGLLLLSSLTLTNSGIGRVEALVFLSQFGISFYIFIYIIISLFRVNKAMKNTDFVQSLKNNKNS